MNDHQPTPPLLKPIRILLIEDDPSDAFLLESMLKREKSFACQLTCASSLTDARTCLAEQTFDVVLSDLALPDSQGLATYEELRQAAPRLPIILLTGHADMETAVNAIKLGAQDYLPKGEFTGLLLTRAIRYAIERKEAETNLAVKEELLRLFIHHTPAAIAVLDTEMRYLQVSERWLKDYCLEGQDLIGKSHYDVFPDLPERWKEGHRRVLAGAVEKCDEDLGRLRPDGTRDWLQWEIRPWHTPGGDSGGVIFFVQIITERKQREAEREKLFAELQAVLTQVKTLRGLLPICGSCKRVRDDRGYWDQIETYIVQYTDASFSHGICPECAAKQLETQGIPVPESLRAAATKQKKIRGIGSP